MMTRNVGVFQTSSMGRLFDAVSVLLEWRDRTNYEGQPAIELESWADEKEQGFYPFEIGGQESSLTICVAGIVRCVVEDLLGGVGKETVSGKFHNTISRVIAETCGRIREHSGLKEVCLSGGVFQNALLLARSVELLAGNGFAVVTHHQVPPNDGGVSLGQAVMANERM
jgi:hydrogenase maturation protein HypF